MALIWGGREINIETGQNRLGKDMDGNAVVVSGSHEAIQDYGWPTVWGAGETKYLAGTYEQISDTRLVRVTPADCANEIR